MATIPTAKPLVRKIGVRALCYALDGQEGRYPVYQFSDVNKLERPNSNPFRGLTDPNNRITESGDARVTEDGDQRITEQP